MNQRGQWAPAPHTLEDSWEGRRLDLALCGFPGPATFSPAWMPDLESSISHSSFLFPQFTSK